MTAVSDETGRDSYLPFDAPLWQQYEHRIKWLMARIGMPDSVSLAEAMKQLLNDAEYIRTNRTPAAALSAAPVAQEPVAYQYRACIAGKWGDWTDLHQSVEGFRNGPWKFGLENGTCELRALYAGTPPATPAGTPANRGDRVIYWLKRYQADEHLDDDACEELDALINVLSKGVKVQPSAGVGADEIARAISAPLWLRPVDGDTYEIAGIDVATNAILALLSRAGDQSNSTHEEQSKQNI